MNLIQEYITSDEQTILEKLTDTHRAAMANKVRLITKLASEEGSLRRALLPKPVNTRAAAQRSLGNTALAEELETEYEEEEFTASEYKARVLGLRDLVEGAKQAEEIALGRIRGGCHAVVRQCAERAAEDYIEKAMELGQLWGMIGAAQAVSVTANSICSPQWNNIEIPAATLEAFKGNTHEAFHRKYVFSGASHNSVIPEHANQLKNELGAIVGLNPFERTR